MLEGNVMPALSNVRPVPYVPVRLNVIRVYIPPIPNEKRLWIPISILRIVTAKRVFKALVTYNKHDRHPLSHASARELEKLHKRSSLPWVGKAPVVVEKNKPRETIGVRLNPESLRKLLVSTPVHVNALNGYLNVRLRP